MAAQGKSLPIHVQQEFSEYLQCGRLEHGFLQVQSTECNHEHLVAFSCKKRVFCPSCGVRRTVIAIVSKPSQLKLLQKLALGDFPDK